VELFQQEFTAGKFRFAGAAQIVAVASGLTQRAEYDIHRMAERRRLWQFIENPCRSDFGGI
jgi:hypothetical protein